MSFWEIYTIVAIATGCCFAFTIGFTILLSNFDLAKSLGYGYDVFFGSIVTIGVSVISGLFWPIAIPVAFVYGVFSSFRKDNKF